MELTKTEKQKYKAIADFIFERMRERKSSPVSLDTHDCAWKSIFQFQPPCAKQALKKISIASLEDGTPTESDWKQFFICNDHIEILKQHNAFEVEEIENG